MKAHVIAANLRDLSYIASNLRPEDFAEVDCQYDAWSPAMLAAGTLQARGFAYVVTLDGNPEAAFGAAEERQGLWTIWSWGTKRMSRCVPIITKFCREYLIPDVFNAGALRGEARALYSNDKARRWLQRLGSSPAVVLRNYGKNGEDFVLYEWVRATSWPLSAKIKRPDEVLEALAPSLSPSLSGGRNDEIYPTDTRLPLPVSQILPVHRDARMANATG